MGVRTHYPHGHFNWVDVMAADLEALVPFYESVFGWQGQSQDTAGDWPYTMFYLDGRPVAGGGQRSPEMAEAGVPPTWNSYVCVEDAIRAVERAAALGGAVVAPAMDVPGAGRMAVVADPEGAHVFLWQPGRHPGAGWVNHPGGFCWNELSTRDLAAAKAFYGEWLGWTFEANPASPSEYAMIRNAGDMNGGIIQMDENWGEAPPRWTVYFSIDDLDRGLERLLAAGGQVPHGPFTADPVGRMAMVVDPQGASFALIQLNAPDE